LPDRKQRRRCTDRSEPSPERASNPPQEPRLATRPRGKPPKRVKWARKPTLFCFQAAAKWPLNGEQVKGEERRGPNPIPPPAKKNKKTRQSTAEKPKSQDTGGTKSTCAKPGPGKRRPGGRKTTGRPRNPPTHEGPRPPPEAKNCRKAPRKKRGGCVCAPSKTKGTGAGSDGQPAQPGPDRSGTTAQRFAIGPKLTPSLSNFFFLWPTSTTGGRGPKQVGSPANPNWGVTDRNQWEGPL